MGRVILPPSAMASQTIDDYLPLTQSEVAAIAGPIMQALQKGCPPDLPAEVQFGVLCRLLQTIRQLGMAGAAVEAERDALMKEVETLKAQVQTEGRVLRIDPRASGGSTFGVSLTTDDRIIAGRPEFVGLRQDLLQHAPPAYRDSEAPHGNCRECERVTDENGNCASCHPKAPPEGWCDRCDRAVSVEAAAEFGYDIDADMCECES